MKNFFDLRLQEFLERRFRIRAEIMDHPPEKAIPAIVTAYLFSGGPSCGGVSSDYAVRLLHGPFALQLDFSVHEESFQIDHWEVRAEGVPKDAVDELTALSDPWQYGVEWQWNCQPLSLQLCPSTSSD